MKKILHHVRLFIYSFMAMALLSMPVYAQDTDAYTVQKGDSLWRIAVKYQAALTDIISANPQFRDPNLIYPGDKVTVPLMSEAKGIEGQVAALVNKERSSRGLQPLTLNWQVSHVARTKSADMRDANYFSHQSPTYGSPFDMLKKFNISYSSAGENIAKGQRTAEAVMNAWMNSEGHRKNILSPNYTEIGVGYVTDSRGSTYWTQMFIRP